MDICLVLDFPQVGEGYVKKGESYWCLETFSDSEWQKTTESQRQEDSMR